MCAQLRKAPGFMYVLLTAGTHEEHTTEVKCNELFTNKCIIVVHNERNSKYKNYSLRISTSFMQAQYVIDSKTRMNS